jgi:8-oxo-dGTP diphosphatase
MRTRNTIQLFSRIADLKEFSVRIFHYYKNIVESVAFLQKGYIMDLIYATFNDSKLRSMVKMLNGLNINLIGLDSLDIKLEAPEENGNSPLLNAVGKAESYFKQLKRPLFSCDSGLFFDEVEEEDQPGVHIKRVNGRTLSDHEMLEYYGNLAGKYGGRLTAYYKNAICLITEEKVFRYDGEELNSEKFYIVSKPHATFRKGFPLDSLSVDIKSMKYYYDLDEEGDDSDIIEGFRNFFIRALKLT